MTRVEAEISHEQWVRWVRFFELEPWGSEIEFLRTGTIAAAVVNASPKLIKGKVASALDFLPERMKRAPRGAGNKAAKIAAPQEAAKVNDRALRAAFFGVFGRDADGNKKDEQ